MSCIKVFPPAKVFIQSTLQQEPGRDKSTKKNPSSSNPEATAVTIYNVTNPQRQRTKLGISALNSAAPHPTGELVKRSSKSKIYESYWKIWVLNSSAESRQSVQPPLQQHSLKKGFLGFYWYLSAGDPCADPCWPSCCSCVGFLRVPTNLQTKRSFLFKRKRSFIAKKVISESYFPQILPSLFTLLVELSAAEQRFWAAKPQSPIPSWKVEILWNFCGKAPGLSSLLRLQHPPKALQRSWSAGVHLPELF